MQAISRSAIYVATFFAFFALAVFFGRDFWRPLDYALFRNVQAVDGLTIEKPIFLIDIPHVVAGEPGFDRGAFRRRLTDALNHIHDQLGEHDRPEAVILDIVFSSDAVELEGLAQALQLFQDRKIPLYFVYDITDRYTSHFEAISAKHAFQIYDRFSLARLHTDFVELDEVLMYASHIDVRREYAEDEPIRYTALALHVAKAVQGESVAAEQAAAAT